MTTKPRLVSGSGAWPTRLCCMLAWALVLALPLHAASAHTRTPRLHKPMTAQEPQVTRTSSARTRSGAPRGNRASSVRERNSAANGFRSSRANVPRSAQREQAYSRASASSDHGRGKKGQVADAYFSPARGTWRVTSGAGNRNFANGLRVPAGGSRDSGPDVRAHRGRNGNVGSGRQRFRGALLAGNGRPGNHSNQGSSPRAASASRSAGTSNVPDELSQSTAAAHSTGSFASGIYARGQANPDDISGVPVPMPGNAAGPASSLSQAQLNAQTHYQPQIVATVESNDPNHVDAAPDYRPPALRTLSPDAPASGMEDAAADLSEGNSDVDPTVIADRLRALSPLIRPSREELAEAAVQPLVLPGMYRDGRLVMPPPLKGSHDVLVHQNTMADAEGLVRIHDDGELNYLRGRRELVDFPEYVGLRVNPELPYNRRCAREWTVRFVLNAAQAYYAHFHQPLQLSSAVRTVRYQLRLQRVNGNAAQVDGEAASPHLTGQAIDFGKSGMSHEEIAWMRGYLLPIMEAGTIDVEEEFQQACFHISVYRSYAPEPRRRVGVKMQAQLQ